MEEQYAKTVSKALVVTVELERSINYVAYLYNSGQLAQYVS